MEVFEHGGYLVLDGTRASLEHVAELLEDVDGEAAGEVAGKIRRGIDSGATRIAIEKARFGCVKRALEAADTGLAEELKEDVDESLERHGFDGVSGVDDDADEVEADADDA